jgi:hypothetical protein
MDFVSADHKVLPLARTPDNAEPERTGKPCGGAKGQPHQPIRTGMPCRLLYRETGDALILFFSWRLPSLQATATRVGGNARSPISWAVFPTAPLFSSVTCLSAPRRYRGCWADERGDCASRARSLTESRLALFFLSLLRPSFFFRSLSDIKRPFLVCHGSSNTA